MISFRRLYLDEYLEKYRYLMLGRVLDVGGKRAGRRGTFSPPSMGVDRWEYLNSDEATSPDYLTTAESIPLPDASIDTVVMTELLEYLANPIEVFCELYRVIKPGAYVIISTPFLNPIHGDDWADRARYTPIMLREMVTKTGFKICSIDPMGSVGAVLYDTLRVAFGYACENDGNKFFSRLLRGTAPIFRLIDKKMITQKRYINTGYFVIIKKPVTN